MKMRNQAGVGAILAGRVDFDVFTRVRWKAPCSALERHPDVTSNKCSRGFRIIQQPEESPGRREGASRMLHIVEEIVDSYPALQTALSPVGRASFCINLHQRWCCSVPFRAELASNRSFIKP